MTFCGCLSIEGGGSAALIYDYLQKGYRQPLVVSSPSTQAWAGDCQDTGGIAGASRARTGNFRGWQTWFS